MPGGDLEAEHRVVEFGIRVGLHAVPLALPPLEVAGRPAAVGFESGGQVDHPRRHRHERGEDVRPNHVGVEDPLQTVDRLVAVAAAADARIVDHRVEWARGVCLRGELDRGGNVGKVANYATRRARDRCNSVGRTGVVAGMQNNLMAEVNELASALGADALCGTGDEDSVTCRNPRIAGHRVFAP